MPELAGPSYQRLSRVEHAYAPTTRVPPNLAQDVLQWISANPPPMLFAKGVVGERFLERDHEIDAVLAPKHRNFIGVTCRANVAADRELVLAQPAARSEAAG